MKQYAAAVQDWETLSIAVDQQIKDQRKLVEWWREYVRPPGQGNNLDPGYFSMKAAEAKSGIAQQKVSRWRTYLTGDIDAYREMLRGPSYRKALLEAQRRADLQTGEMEWFTPSIYVEKARRVLGAIDLDPASCALAQQVVNASRFFTLEDDGLDQDWEGAVWLNPPYCRALLAPFVDKLVSEWERGAVSQAILLTHNYTDTIWFHTAARAARAICFPSGRIHFLAPSGEECSPTQGQALFFFGRDDTAFCATFAEVGLIMGPLTPRRRSVGSVNLRRAIGERHAQRRQRQRRRRRR